MNLGEIVTTVASHGAIVLHVSLLFKSQSAMADFVAGSTTDPPAKMRSAARRGQIALFPRQQVGWPAANLQHAWGKDHVLSTT
jgi:hypothetical protein